MQPQWGQKTCITCGVGKFAPHFETMECSACPAGLLSAVGSRALSSCRPTKQCPAGQVHSGCPPAGNGHPQQGLCCSPCKAGTFNDNAKGLLCTSCPIGKYQAATSQTSCHLCQGAPEKTAAAETCAPCPSGSAWHVTACSSCPAGKHLSGVGQQAGKLLCHNSNKLKGLRTGGMTDAGLAYPQVELVALAKVLKKRKGPADPVGGGW